MELSVNPGPKPIGHVIQTSIALQRYEKYHYLQTKSLKNRMMDEKITKMKEEDERIYRKLKSLELPGFNCFN